MRPSSRILYVDDDKDSRNLAGALLNNSDSDCTVISSESAKEARLLIVKENFDLYIFDNLMPEISGIELCRCVRVFDSAAPVLFFSATAKPVDIAEAMEAGANEYLLKPNDLEKLPVTVRRLLDDAFLARGRRSVIKNSADPLPQTSSEQVLQSEKIQPLIQRDAFQKSMADLLKTQLERFSEAGGEIREKRFHQNQIRTDKAGRLRVRPLLTGAAIFAIIVLHFASQFVFFQSEKIVSETEAVDKEIVEVKRENEPGAEIRTEYEAKNSDAERVPDAVSSEPKLVPSRAVIKKKEPRESKAERLRRAERILTGI